MVNTPVPLNLVALVSDPNQRYAVHLITNPFTDLFWSGLPGYQEPADRAYAPVRCGISSLEATPDGVQALLDTPLWDFRSYSQSITLTGYVISAVFDDGETILDVVQFPQTILVGPGGQPDLSLPCQIGAVEFPADLPLPS